MPILLSPQDRLRPSFRRGCAIALTAMTVFSANAGPAHALSVTNSGLPEGTGGVGLSTSTTDDLSRTTITFSWEDTPFTGFVQILTSFDFDFLYTGYSELSGDAVSGLVVEAIEGTSRERLTIEDDLCLAAANPLTGACTLLTGAASSGGQTGEALRPSFDTALFSLSAGEYLIGFYEDDTPETGSASFLLAEAAPNNNGGIGVVPLPGAFASLFAALGLLWGLTGRRRPGWGHVWRQQRLWASSG